MEQKCGTLSGPGVHRARGEATCAECKAVRAEYERERRKRRPPTDEQRRRWAQRAKHPDAIRTRRDRDYRNLYGIGIDDVERLSEEQGGTCAICREVCSTGQELAVDHCHDTGKVRGLLCSNCNTGIGKLGDDPARLRAAVRYLTA